MSNGMAVSAQNVGNTGIAGLSDTLSDRIAASLHDLKADADAYSPATWNMVNHCWGRWAEYCRVKGCMTLPVDPDVLREYLPYLAETLSVASVALHLHGINFVQRNADLPSVTKEPRINRVMRLLRRQAAENRETIGQAIPLRLADLRLLSVVYGGSEQLSQLRDLALLVTAYHTMLREAEVARLQVRDIQSGENGTGAVYVARTKTNVSGDGEYRVLSAWALKIVRDWITRAELGPEDYLFCKVSRYNRPVKAKKPLSGVAIDGVFRRAYLSLGNEPQETDRYSVWTGHSARVGAALDLAAAGCSAPQIMQAGGWKSSEMVMRYIRRVSLAENAMVKLTQ